MNNIDPVNSNAIDILESCRIDPQEDIERPPVAIMINSEGGPTPSFTLGNFSMVIGKAKSKKTFLIGVLAAAAVTGTQIINVVEGSLPANKRKVLYFDTEQGRFHANRSIKRISLLSGIDNPDNLLAYGLRKFRPEVRLKLIETAIYMHSNIGLVIIDGGRDLLSAGINDEKLATDVTSDFLRWTEERAIHLIVVLHQNKNDLNARGHFGTECINKAETTLSVTEVGSDIGISVVKCDYSRDKPFRDFAFRINDSGLPESISTLPRAGSCRRVTGSDQVDEITHKEVIADIYCDHERFKYEPMWHEIKGKFEEQDITIADNTAKSFLTLYVNRGWIVKDKTLFYNLGSIDEV